MTGFIRWFFSRRLTFQFIIIGIFFTIARVFIGENSVGGIDTALLAPVVVLFSLFISFVINSQRSRYDSFFENNRAESSVLFSIHLFSKAFSKRVQEDVRKLMDNYLVMQMDFKLNDFKETDKGFTELAEYLMSIEPSGDSEVEAKDKILDLIPSDQERRYNMQTLLTERVARSEWITILSLYVATIYSFLLFRTPDAISILIGSLVCTAATMLVLVLYKLDTLSYKTSEKISEPIQRLFVDLELMPYYSGPQIESGQVKPIKGVKVRVASYPHAYPDMADKKVEVKVF